MSSLLEEAINRVSGLPALGHFGESSQGKEASLREALTLSCDAIRDATNTETSELRRLYQLGRVAAIVALILVAASVIMVLRGLLTLGVASAIAGLVTHAITVLLFRRVDTTRASLQLLLPDYRAVFALLAVLDAGQQFPGLTADISARLLSASRRG